MTTADKIYLQVEEKIRVMLDDGGYTYLTCLEGPSGCEDCYFKRAPGKPQKAFCNAVLCGAWERMDEKEVIFQEIKGK